MRAINPGIMARMTVLITIGWLVLAVPTHGAQLVVDVHPPTVAIEAGADNTAVFACTGVQWMNQPGEPRIPWQVLNLLLPPDVDLATVHVRLQESRYEEIEGVWFINPSPPEVTWKDGKPLVIWPTDRRIVDGRDLEIYERDAIYPETTARLVSTGRMRKWRLAQVAVPLVRYNPVKGLLYRLVEGQLEIGYEEILNHGTDLVRLRELSDGIGESTVRRLVVNFYPEAQAYDAALGRLMNSMGKAASEIMEMGAGGNGYIIITTSAIQSASAHLSSFVTHKTSQGFDVQVITETVWGGGTGDTAAENIRAWLQANYVSEAIEYVLLIGNPDPNTGDVPMKLLYPRARSPFYWTPSDYYYADLTGNWDLDGDNVYGEYEGDFGTGGVDRNWEVMVGRIPYYDKISELDTILERIIDYQSRPGEQTTWRRNVLLPMADLGDLHPLSDWLGEDIKDDILMGAGWSYHRIYEDNHMGWDPPPETMPCTKDIVTDVWGNGSFGLVVWFTHGSATSAQDVMDISRVNELNDNYKAFTFQTSCHTACPEENDNLAYELLLYGAINTIGATRVSWSLSGHNIEGEATIEGMAYEYTARVVPMGFPSARALNELRQAIAPTYYSGGLWMNYVDCNVYGDPSASIYMPESRVHNITRDVWYPVIQWAIDEAENGDEIVLEPGSYGGIANRDLDFEGKVLTIRSTDPNDDQVVADTVIDAGGHRRIFYFHNAEDENAVINGVTLLNSDTAIYCLNSSPTITNCTFSGHSGAIDLNNSYAKISNCTFTGNSGYEGGGISTSSGSPEVTECIFSDNTAQRGGAIYVSAGGEPVLRNCILMKNTASDGGGFYGGSFGKCTLERCIISNNTADNHGGGLFLQYGVSLVNASVSGNTAGSRGGGIYSNMYSQIVTNCSVTGNRAVDYGGGFCGWGSTVDMVNSILWGNTALDGAEIALLEFPHSWASTILTTSYSDVQGGEPAVYLEGESTLNWDANINQDPLFLDPGSWDENGTPGDHSDDIWNEGDYHLTQDSPCIDVGANDATDLPDTDFEGDMRIVDGDNNGTAKVDMGADEYVPTIEQCEGNFDGDGDVDGTDLAIFAADFGRTYCSSPPPCEGDFDGDGDVDGSDLAVFAADFGRTDCP